MSAENQTSLVVLSEDLQREVETVQHLRKVLHDAYIVESKESKGKSAEQPPPAVEVHRTLDAPTLALLKAPNYPFLLCEGAPPAYVPPPVPYDVEGEVANMKGKVLQVQRDLVAFKAAQSKSHAAKPKSKDPEEEKQTMRDELVDFLDGHQVFSELAWQVSSLEWFYRWVLSHSISHLWNAKDQLEFVLTENGQTMPDSADVMDEALEKCPFTQAVTILDNDRQTVIAQERRRLRSVSRTFRDRLPPAAVTAATSCYLSSEEKYMYQEFYNQSEHLLLLLDHTLLMERSTALGTAGAKSRSRASSGSRGGPQQQQPGAASDGDASALVQQASTAGEVSNIDGLTQEALAAFNAEHEVIRTLMDTIRERRRDNVQFAVSDDEYQRSRTAQMAVYGCVVSDMNLMAQQMAVAKEFMEKYEQWVQFHGFDDHDSLMQLLVERSGGTGWPYMSMHGAGTCDGGDGGHGHFTPPTAVWAKEHSQPNASAGSRQPSAPLGGNVASPAVMPKSPAASNGKAHADGASTSVNPGNNANVNSRRTSDERPGVQPLSLSGTTNASVSRRPDSDSKPSHSTARTPAGIAEVFYTVLCHVDSYIAGDSPHGVKNAATATSDDNGSAQRLDRMWMAAAMRVTVLRLAQSQWTTTWLLNNLDSVEEELLRRLHQRPAYETLTAAACALMVMFRELLTLTRRTASTVKNSLTEIRVALHHSRAGDDLKREVLFALIPVEYERWGGVLDALWFQADPSGAANGGMLLPAEASAGGAGPAMPGFQRLEKIALPVMSPQSASATGASVNQPVPVLSLFYRIQSSAAVPPAPTAPPMTLAAILHREAASAPRARNNVAAQCARRYHYARAALAALHEVEAKGLLPCYACRMSECGDAPLDAVLFLSAPQAASDVMGASVGLLPPGATQLLRIFKRTGLTRPATTSTTVPFDVYAKESVSFCSIGVMVAALLSNVADASYPVLKDLHMMAESTLEQASWEHKSGVVPKSFVNATTHPVAMSCVAAKARAISIQREASVPNRNSISLRRFVAPLLRHLDDYLSTADFDVMAAEGETDAQTGSNKPVASPQASTTARRTDLYDAGNRANASPSPSAVRPRGY